MPSFDWVGPTLAVASTGVAAYTDIRTRRIPNALTLTSLGLGAACALLTQGVGGLLEHALLGALLTALVPYASFRVSNGRAIGGGDVKLLAALGALLGPSLGLEVELFALLLLLVFGAAVLAYRGELLHALVQAGRRALWSVSPQRDARPRPDHEGLSLPMGPAVALATLCLVAARGLALGGP